jgi:serine/threonine protein kinase
MDEKNINEKLESCFEVFRDGERAWRVGKFLGKGEWGSVYEFCYKKKHEGSSEGRSAEFKEEKLEGSPTENCGFAMKISIMKKLLPEELGSKNRGIPITELRNSFRKRANKSIRVSKIASELGLAPKVEDSCVTGDYSILISEKMDIDLKTLIENMEFEKKHIEGIVDIVANMIKKLHSNGMVHGDISVGNVMFKNVSDPHFWQHIRDQNFVEYFLKAVHDGIVVAKFIDFDTSGLKSEMDLDFYNLMEDEENYDHELLSKILSKTLQKKQRGSLRGI